ncbi:pickpocket protein 28-like [Photinus pyralis]|uniref:pickpocket protein 28-like n=1 Tax=Photinus pyralis TaxID=7054 RepID=UPI0012674687|nr:pickpocket protein 28-like [Photinus pyralis]
MKLVMKRMEEYFRNSTLHGLRYVGDPLISFGERFFWLLAFFVALLCATYFINNIYSKYNRSPIIISLNPTATPIGSLPFPAITICSMNQAIKKEAEQIMLSGTDVEKMLLDDYCNGNSSFGNLSNLSEEVGKWENVQKFILRVNPPCQETIRTCFWQQQEYACTDVFNNGLTDDGLCCTFNALPRDYIFRNPQDMAILNLTFQREVDDWNPERGFLPNASLTALPWRAKGPGTHLGLTLVLDAQLSSYYCSSSTGVGFKVLLHNPLETPKMADFAILISPGLESRVSIEPKIYDASYTIKEIEIEKRMCYFTNERSLQFYRTYTELNCKLECQTNLTLSLCGCVPFYLPRNRLKKICSKSKQICSNLAKEIMEIHSQNGSSCHCLPGCFELGFEASVSFGQLTDTFKIREQYIKNVSPEYFRQNMAVLHFFFTESKFTSYTKSELYGFSEFLSNTGGLLGLFLGFGALSCVEIFYYFFLKVVCNSLQSRRKSKQNMKIKKRVVTKGYPFHIAN